MCVGRDSRQWVGWRIGCGDSATLDVTELCIELKSRNFSIAQDSPPRA